MQGKVIKGLLIGAMISGLAIVSGCGSSTDSKPQASTQPPAQTQQAAAKTEGHTDAAKYIAIIKGQNEKIYQLSKDNKFVEAKNEFSALDEAFDNLRPAIKNEDLKRKLDHAIDEIGDELKKEKPKKGEIEEEYEVINKVLKDIEAQK
jgi:outer membrane murein-binding lipoprotein Lpp